MTSGGAPSRALASLDYLALGGLAGGISRHGVGRRPARYEMDVSLIYGDYYFIEVLIRLREANLTLALAPRLPRPTQDGGGEGNHDDPRR